MTDLSLILALYEEGPTLPDSLQRIVEELERLPWTWEIILVDDGSTDDSRLRADQFAAQHPDQIRASHHDTNRGRGAAVANGLRIASGTVAGYLDVDLEISESVIEPCVVPILFEGYDASLGERTYRLRPRSWFRHLLSRGYAVIVRALVATSIRDTESGCKWFRRDSILPVLDHVQSEGWFFDTEIMVLAERAGLSISQIPVTYSRRFDKASTVKPLKDSLSSFRQLFDLRRRLKRQGGPPPSQ